MILEVDFGNTRIKWRNLGARATGTEPVEVGHASTVSSFLDSLQHQGKPDAIRVASVRKGDSLSEFSRWVSAHWGLTPVLAEVSRQCAGVTNSYADVSRMGVDRWLAMLSAYEQAQSACLIIDGGTALTIDVLDSSGLHLGGYILPGLALMARALEANTGIRLQETDTEVGVLPGRNTEQAVRNAALAAASALVEKTHSAIVGKAQPVATYLSGGDAQVLRSCLNLQGEVTINPDLVLDGLALACPLLGEKATQDYDRVE